MRVLNLDNWCDEAKEILNKVAKVKTEMFGIGNVDGIITTLSPLPYYPCLNMLPNLKFVASCTTGLDHIDADYCRKNGIKLIYLDDEWKQKEGREVYATAEHTWALIMSLIRKIPFAHNDVVCVGNWNREMWQGTELHDKTLGIVGYGRVGQQVAKLAEVFGMGIIANDIRTKFEVGPLRFSYPIYPLPYTLERADIISIHVPLNEKTKGMFNYEQFAMMKPTAYLLNTSRGQIVDEDALLWALSNKKIAGAALDVVEGEPDIDKCLLEYAKNNNNLIITPHIAGNTAESRKKTQIYIAKKIKEYIENTERSV